MGGTTVAGNCSTKQQLKALMGHSLIGKAGLTEEHERRGSETIGWPVWLIYYLSHKIAYSVSWLLETKGRLCKGGLTEFSRV
jgi:hypothetical protein